MFEIDVAGLRELEGGKPPQRLAFEPIANVFDEYRRGQPPPAEPSGERTRAIDLGDAPRWPTRCEVQLEHSSNPRGVYLIVTDNGPGFADERDIWTLFATTPKRSDPALSGRFNAGEKQLIALSRQAIVMTRNTTVVFKDGKREVRHTSQAIQGTVVQVLLPWSNADLLQTEPWLMLARPPQGLEYIVNGYTIVHAPVTCTVTVTLPTVVLRDGVMRETHRKTRVDVFRTGDQPMLYELGIPVCELSDLGFPLSLDVQQKIPLPMSRDAVSPAYLYQLIGRVLEEAALQEVSLLTPEEAGASFVRGALEWVHDADALRETVRQLYGADAVRVSSDPVANVRAAQRGVPLVSGREFGPETRRSLEAFAILPTAKTRFGGSDERPAAPAASRGSCPQCGRPFSTVAGS